jgi:RNA polymerase sigma factor (sigma-70 family)
VNKAEDIYQALIAPIERRMAGSIARLVRDPEETADVLQSALEAVWRDLERIHRHANPQGYILKLCASAAHDALRRRGRLRRLFFAWDARHEQIAEAGPGLSEAEAGAERRRLAVLDAIARLPAKQAQAVILRVYEEQDFAAVAQAIGCREVTARSHYSKAVARLRELLHGTEILEEELS